MRSTRSSGSSRLLSGALALLLAAGLASGLGFALAGFDLLEHLPHATLCPFRGLTGIPCPGCGMTRAFVLLSQLRLAEAFAMHPASPLLAGAALARLAAPALFRRLPDAAAAALLAAVLGGWLTRLG